MSKKDPLAGELSVSASLTQTGVKAKVRSRFASAVDRLLGNKVDSAGVQDERNNAVERARMESDIRVVDALAKAQVKAIEASTKALLDRINSDSEFALRTLNAEYEKMFRRQANKEDVLFAASDHLEHLPPSDEESSHGSEKLSDEFSDRFETYAEFASTEELKRRWGRVLAEEIRRPGTFSAKALRIVDELDAETAASFEALCINRIGGAIPLCLSEDMTYGVQTDLVTAGLLIDPGIAKQLMKFADGNSKQGPIRIVVLGDYALAISSDETIPAHFPSRSPLALTSDGTLALRVRFLTRTGAAIGTILQHSEEAVLTKLQSHVQEAVGEATVRRFYRPFGQTEYYPMDAA